MPNISWRNKCIHATSWVHEKTWTQQILTTKSYNGTVQTSKNLDVDLQTKYNSRRRHNLTLLITNYLHSKGIFTQQIKVTIIFSAIFLCIDLAVDAFYYNV